MRLEVVTDIDSTSGYSNFARTYIKALLDYGVKIQLNQTKHDKSSIELDDWWKANIGKLLESPQLPDAKVYIETPEFFQFHPNIKNVGYTFWETTRIASTHVQGNPVPDQRYNWVSQMNKMNLMLTGCRSSKQSFIKSGVNTPIEVIGCPVKQHDINEELLIHGVTINQSTNIIERNARPFVFGSIAQWTWRKNLEDLIVAFCTEFQPGEAVLCLKTYLTSPIGGGSNIKEESIEIAHIENKIKEIKGGIGYTLLPEVVLIGASLTDEQMLKLHNSFDAYVNPSRGEGFCLPAVTAMLAGSAVLSTDFSATQDYVIAGETGWPVKCTMEPVYNMPLIPWYDCKHEWGRINILDLRKKMRDVKENRYQEIRDAGQRFIRETYSPKAVAERTVKAIETILD